MRCLIAEDDFASRKFILKVLSKYADCDVTVDGMEAIEAFMLALEEGDPYDFICLDVMMPRLDGYKTLKKIREIEEEKEIPKENNVKIIMTTALNEKDNVFEAFEGGCQAYAAKPLDTEKLLEVMKKLGLIS